MTAQSSFAVHSRGTGLHDFVAWWQYPVSHCEFSAQSVVGFVVHVLLEGSHQPLAQLALAVHAVGLVSQRLVIELQKPVMHWPCVVHVPGFESQYLCRVDKIARHARRRAS